jgi:hypothetical protein
VIWVTWRQHRAQAAVGAVVFAAVATGLLIVGTVARIRARSLDLPACLSAQRDCEGALEKLHGYFHTIPPFTGALVVLPILAGMFWGAPLVSREYEAGTHRLAWTQSVSPLRWITTKLVLIFAVVTAAALAISVLALWALSPLMPAFGGRFNSTWYDIQGIVPVACMVFALSVGIAASALIRRTIPAMAVTILVYAFARIPIHWVRPHFAPSATRTVNVPLNDLLQNAVGSPSEDFTRTLRPGDWFIEGQVTDPSGHLLRATMNNIDILRSYCPDLAATRTELGPLTPSAACQAKLQGMSLHETITYQPASHFWSVQVAESVIFLISAALLVGAAIFAVTRRRPA